MFLFLFYFLDEIVVPSNKNIAAFFLSLTSSMRFEIFKNSDTSCYTQNVTYWPFHVILWFFKVVETNKPPCPHCGQGGLFVYFNCGLHSLCNYIYVLLTTSTGRHKKSVVRC